jgi:cell division protein FtsB
MRRALWPLILSVVLVGILFLFVFPARTYLDQRRRLAVTQQRLQVLAQRNAELTSRVQLLNTDAEIERLARERYSLVKPGEEAYAILPPPPPPGPQSKQKPAHPPKPAPAKPGSPSPRHGSPTTAKPAHKASPSFLSRLTFWR